MSGTVRACTGGGALTVEEVGLVVWETVGVGVAIMVSVNCCVEAGNGFVSVMRGL